MPALPTAWFIAIAVLWSGYLFLEGFDLGVGMLMKTFARNNTERRVLLNTVGPVWDGNEVWLITAVGAMFAAFPLWYASLLSSLYIPLILVLLALIFRAVAFEYRGKIDNPRWRVCWDWAIAVGSFVAAFGIGVSLAVTTTGLPINANGDRVGGPFAWFSWSAMLGGVAVVAFCVIQAAAFLSLKTDDEIRRRAGRLVRRYLPVGLLPLLGWAVVVNLDTGATWAWIVTAAAALAGITAQIFALLGREGRTFITMGVSLLAGIAGVAVAAYPVVLPSTITPAFDLTVANASSSDYTLGLMSIVACFGIPLVLAYQAWSYWVFRRRISAKNIPAAHAPTAHAPAATASGRRAASS